MQRFYYGNQIVTRFRLRHYYVNNVLLRPYQDPTASFFDCVLDIMNMYNVRPRPLRPWRPYRILIIFYCIPTTM